MKDGKYTAFVTVRDNHTHMQDTFDIQLDDGMILVGDRGERVVGATTPITFFEMIGDVTTAFAAEHYPKDKRGPSSVYGLMMLVDTMVDTFEDDLDPRVAKAVKDATDTIADVIDEQIAAELESKENHINEMLESEQIDERLKEVIRGYVSKLKEDA